MLFVLTSLALAQEGEMTYEGNQSGTAEKYVKGKPITVTHSGGNVAVRCMDTEKLTARLAYTVFGTQEGPMESMGSGIGLAVWGDHVAGGVKTRMPSKPVGVARAEATLTVNVPMGPAGVTVTQSGSGWVQVLDCAGNVKVSAGAGGAYVSGTLNSAVVTASGGDVKVVQNADAVFKGTTAVNAPGGNAHLALAPSQGGKLTAKGAEVAVTQTVMNGTQTENLIAGELGIAGPAITVSAKAKAEVVNNR